jgi:translation initiation factor IF-3
VAEEKAPEVKMNEDLSTFEKFLLIGKDKKSLGVVSYHDAYAMAKKEGVDLVLVQANASPPVAKLLAPTDKKLQKIKASRSAGIKEKIKEVQFSEVITEHDMQVKITKLRSMLKRQYRVRVRIQFKDRKNFDQELAREIMLNVAARVKDLALRDSRTGFKVESSAVYSLLVPRTLLPEDATDADETKETKSKNKEKAPATDKNKPSDNAKAATASAAAESLKPKPHPAEAMQDEDIEEDLAEELEEEEGEGDGLADLAPEEIEELLAQLEREEKQKKQNKQPPAVAAKKGEPTKNAASKKDNNANRGKDNNANKGKDNNANKQADNRANQRDNKNQNQNRNNNDNKRNR